MTGRDGWVEPVFVTPSPPPAGKQGLFPPGAEHTNNYNLGGILRNVNLGSNPGPSLFSNSGSVPSPQNLNFVI